MGGAVGGYEFNGEVEVHRLTPAVIHVSPYGRMD